MKHEFEYIKNGTMNVLAFLNHANGQVYAECQPDHKTDTLIDVFTRHVANCQNSEPLHYVMDNLSTHNCYKFCEAIAKLSAIDCPDKSKLNTLEKRMNWLKSPDKRIVIHFTPYHGSWLNFVEYWFGILDRKVLRESFGSAEELMGTFEEFLEKWNTLFLHTFKWQYDGKGLHEKAVRRFTQMLERSAKKMEISMLTKQLRLMKNLFDDYRTKISDGVWQKMIETVDAKHRILEQLIEAEEGPKRTKKAVNALTSIMQLIKPEYDCGQCLIAA